MLWVYDHHKYAYFYSAEIDFRRQNLTSTNVRIWRLPHQHITLLFPTQIPPVAFYASPAIKTVVCYRWLMSDGPERGGVGIQVELPALKVGIYQILLLHRLRKVFR